MKNVWNCTSRWKKNFYNRNGGQIYMKLMTNINKFFRIESQKNDISFNFNLILNFFINSVWANNILYWLTRELTLVCLMLFVQREYLHHKFIMTRCCSVQSHSMVQFMHTSEFEYMQLKYALPANIYSMGCNNERIIHIYPTERCRERERAIRASSFIWNVNLYAKVVLKVDNQI